MPYQSYNNTTKEKPTKTLFLDVEDGERHFIFTPELFPLTFSKTVLNPYPTIHNLGIFYGAIPESKISMHIHAV